LGVVFAVSAVFVHWNLWPLMSHVALSDGFELKKENKVGTPFIAFFKKEKNIPFKI
jgi:hypothetical protein